MCVKYSPFHKLFGQFMPIAKSHFSPQQIECEKTDFLATLVSLDPTPVIEKLSH